MYFANPANQVASEVRAFHFHKALHFFVFSPRMDFVNETLYSELSCEFDLSSAFDYPQRAKKSINDAIPQTDVIIANAWNEGGPFEYTFKVSRNLALFSR